MEVRDQSDQVMDEATVHRTCSAGSVAAAEGTDLVTAVPVGAATITAGTEERRLRERT